MGARLINPILGTCGDYPPMIINPYAFSGFDPLSLSPALWLDASAANTLYDATSGGSLVASGGSVARWEDKSGNVRHATLTGTGTSPSRQTAIVNGRDVVRFPGSDRRLKTASWSLAQPFTALVVWKLNTGAAGQNVIDGIGTGRAAIYWRSGVSKHGSFLGTSILDGRTLSAPSSAFLTSLIANGASTKIYYNASLDVSGNSGTSAPGGITVGGEAGTGADLIGDVAEILIFGSSLSDANRQAAEAYLNSKWAIY